eukprot:jgi/Mesvir1/11732/Mv00108-RA.2
MSGFQNSPCEVAGSIKPSMGFRSCASHRWLTVGWLAVVVVLLSTASTVWEVFQFFENNHCRMTYMFPGYVPLDGPQRSNHDGQRPEWYRLVMYRETDPSRATIPSSRPSGAPVLYIPGNAGSYKQVRSLASQSHGLFRAKSSSGSRRSFPPSPTDQRGQREAQGMAHASQPMKDVRGRGNLHVETVDDASKGYSDSSMAYASKRSPESVAYASSAPFPVPLDWYAVDFDEQLSALDAGVLAAQTAYVVDCVEYLLALYAPQGEDEVKDESLAKQQAKGEVGVKSHDRNLNKAKGLQKGFPEPMAKRRSGSAEAQDRQDSHHQQRSVDSGAASGASSQRRQLSVILLGHSMGGVVARAAASHPRLRRRCAVRWIFTLATPHVASPIGLQPSMVRWYERLRANWEVDANHVRGIQPPVIGDANYPGGQEVLENGTSHRAREEQGGGGRGKQTGRETEGRGRQGTSHRAPGGTGCGSIARCGIMLVSISAAERDHQVRSALTRMEERPSWPRPPSDPLLATVTSCMGHDSRWGEGGGGRHGCHEGGSDGNCGVVHAGDGGGEGEAGCVCPSDADESDDCQMQRAAHTHQHSSGGGSVMAHGPHEQHGSSMAQHAVRSLSVSSTAIPGVWLSADHQSVLWCNQLARHLAESLLMVAGIVHRGAQSHARDDANDTNHHTNDSSSDADDGTLGTSGSSAGAASQNSNSCCRGCSGCCEDGGSQVDTDVDGTGIDGVRNETRVSEPPFGAASVEDGRGRGSVECCGCQHNQRQRQVPTEDDVVYALLRWRLLGGSPDRGVGHAAPRGARNDDERHGRWRSNGQALVATAMGDAADARRILPDAGRRALPDSGTRPPGPWGTRPPREQTKGPRDQTPREASSEMTSTSPPLDQESASSRLHAPPDGQAGPLQWTMAASEVERWLRGEDRAGEDRGDGAPEESHAQGTRGGHVPAVACPRGKLTPGGRGCFLLDGADQKRKRSQSPSRDTPEESPWFIFALRGDGVRDSEPRCHWSSSTIGQPTTGSCQVAPNGPRSLLLLTSHPAELLGSSSLGCARHRVVGWNGAGLSPVVGASPSQEDEPPPLEPSAGSPGRVCGDVGHADVEHGHASDPVKCAVGELGKVVITDMSGYAMTDRIPAPVQPEAPPPGSTAPMPPPSFWHATVIPASVTAGFDYIAVVETRASAACPFDRAEETSDGTDGRISTGVQGVGMVAYAEIIQGRSGLSGGGLGDRRALLLRAAGIQNTLAEGHASLLRIPLPISAAAIPLTLSLQPVASQGLPTGGTSARCFPPVPMLYQPALGGEVRVFAPKPASAFASPSSSVPAWLARLGLSGSPAEKETPIYSDAPPLGLVSPRHYFHVIGGYLQVIGHYGMMAVQQFVRLAGDDSGGGSYGKWLAGLLNHGVDWKELVPEEDQLLVLVDPRCGYQVQLAFLWWAAPSRIMLSYAPSLLPATAAVTLLVLSLHLLPPPGAFLILGDVSQKLQTYFPIRGYTRAPCSGDMGFLQAQTLHAPSTANANTMHAFEGVAAATCRIAHLATTFLGRLFLWGHRPALVASVSFFVCLSWCTLGDLPDECSLVRERMPLHSPTSLTDGTVPLETMPTLAAALDGAQSCVMLACLGCGIVRHLAAGALVVSLMLVGGLGTFLLLVLPCDAAIKIFFQSWRGLQAALRAVRGCLCGPHILDQRQNKMKRPPGATASSQDQHDLVLTDVTDVSLAATPLAQPMVPSTYDRSAVFSSCSKHGHCPCCHPAADKDWHTSPSHGCQGRPAHIVTKGRAVMCLLAAALTLALAILVDMALVALAAWALYAMAALRAGIHARSYHSHLSWSRRTQHEGQSLLLPGRPPLSSDTIFPQSGGTRETQLPEGAAPCRADVSKQDRSVPPTGASSGPQSGRGQGDVLSHPPQLAPGYCCAGHDPVHAELGIREGTCCHAARCNSCPTLDTAYTARCGSSSGQDTAQSCFQSPPSSCPSHGCTAGCPLCGTRACLAACAEGDASALLAPRLCRAYQAVSCLATLAFLAAATHVPSMVARLHGLMRGDIIMWLR